MKTLTFINNPQHIEKLEKRIKELEFICESNRWLINTYNLEIIEKILETSDSQRREQFKKYLSTQKFSRVIKKAGSE